MTEQDLSQADLSTQVVGRLSAMQEQDLKTFGLEIFRSLGLDPQKEKDKEKVREVIVDCVLRGLESQGRIWVGKDEEISPLFRIGLYQRREVVDRAQTIMTSSEFTDILLSEEEKEGLRTVGVFSLNLPDIEELLVRFKAESKAINDFRKRVLFESKIGDDARKLKNEFSVDPFSDSRVYANFILNIAIYRKAGVRIKIDDILTLKDFWGDPRFKTKSVESVLGQIKGLASQIGIDNGPVEKYTLLMINRIENFLSDDLTIDSLANSYVFAITETQVEDARAESVTNDNELYFDYDQIRKARESFELFLQLEKDYLTEISKSEEESEELDALWLRIGDLLSEIDGLKLLYLLRGSHLYINDNSQIGLNDTVLLGDIEDSSPVNAYINALRIISSQSIKVTNDGSELQDFSDTILKSFLRKKITDGVSTKIENDENILGEIASELPEDFLLELLSRKQPEFLSQSQLAAILDLSNDKWVRLFRQSGTTYNPQTGHYTVQDSSIEPFYEQLPQERKSKIEHGLRQPLNP